ncbi:MAG: hypothetical protein A2521_10660 [Deltaproteobacteria bacterium RIFOXYD12_FULL_57_12]|nr:MAG: hypothetical protein A2521_10660 [Deltaproteobacteria bacterium RIFOXYD12_FULL_57_12]
MKLPRSKKITDGWFLSCCRAVIAAAFLLVLALPQPAQTEEGAAPPAAVEAQTAKAPDAGPSPIPEVNDGFEYKREGRPDPFMPFAQVVLQGAAEEEILTGMRRFEPGQLRLVAIVAKGKSYRAMVEDSAGKGYTIDRGTLIGRTGVVEDIAPNQVIIKETTYTMAGERRFNTVEMLLKTRGEEE